MAFEGGDARKEAKVIRKHVKANLVADGSAGRINAGGIFWSRLEKLQEPKMRLEGSAVDRCLGTLV
jgi:hypothetical protein